MDDERSIEQLRDLGNGVAAPAAVVLLYHEAFARYRLRALWSARELDHPSIAQALATAESLRTEGDVAARALAVAMERACRAAL